MKPKALKLQDIETARLPRYVLKYAKNPAGPVEVKFSNDLQELRDVARGLILLDNCAELATYNTLNSKRVRAHTYADLELERSRQMAQARLALENPPEFTTAQLRAERSRRYAAQRRELDKLPRGPEYGGYALRIEE